MNRYYKTIHNNVIFDGQWSCTSSISYLDQHYSLLDSEKTALQTIEDIMPNTNHIIIRQHLNRFLFRMNEEVSKLTAILSGGERALLSLAQIAAQTPQLLLLDEITNNIDIVIREHLIQILKKYPGAMIIISHNVDFLNQLQITKTFNTKDCAIW